MTNPNDPSRILDRRRYPRSEVVATAVVFSEDRLHGTYLVRDLSAGGACLVGDMAAPGGERVTVLLQFPGKTPFSLQARTVRNDDHHRKSARTAISFIDLSAEDEDSIHEAIMNALERENTRRSATILVVDHDASCREALERDLRALGHQAVGVATPLEALAWLDRPDARIATVVVDLSPGPSQGLDVLEFLGAHHPNIQRVVMADELRPFRLDLALRSGRAHKALHKPWDTGRLAETIGGVPAKVAVAGGRD